MQPAAGVRDVTEAFRPTALPDLVAAARGGDERAIEALLRRAQPDARRFARRTCATAEDAEDAVQLTLWQSHRRVGSLRDATALVAWIFKIVTRLCLRILRLRRRETAYDPTAFDRLVETTPEPVLRRDLLRAMSALSEPHREILILRDIEERTAPEVSTILGISTEAVKSRLNRARTALREQLIDGGYGE